MVVNDCSLKEIHDLTTQMEENIMMRKANNRKSAHEFRPNCRNHKIPRSNMANKVMQGRIHKHC